MRYFVLRIESTTDFPAKVQGRVGVITSLIGVIGLLGTPLQAQNIGSALDGFDPNPNNDIQATVPLSDGKILVAGGFTSIGGQPRNRIARLHPDGSVDLDFDPNINTPVYGALEQPDGKILVWGEFTDVGGETRNRIARLHADGSLDMTFDPDVNSPVWTVALQEDGKILLGGLFTTVSGQTRNRIARLDTDGSLDTGFDPNANFHVFSITVQPDGKLLVGGQFTQIGGLARSYFVRLFPDGAIDAAFDPNVGASVMSSSVLPDGKIVVAGDFTTVGGEPRNNLVQLEEDGSVDVSFPNPGGNARARSLVVQSDGKIVVGGRFTTMGGETRNYIARFLADGSLDMDFDPGANFWVYSLGQQADGKLLVGGLFNSLGGKTRNHIARLYSDGSVDDHLPNLGGNGNVYTVGVQADQKILVGGNITSIGGAVRERIARFDVKGNLDPTFDPNANGSVRNLVEQPDGKILIGGAFTTIGGQPRIGIARVKADGALDTTFAPGSNSTVYSVALQSDQRILLGGAFLSMGGQTRNYIARLESDGSLDTGFDPNANNSVFALAVQADGMILMGGNFTSLGGQTRNYLARLHPNGNLDTSFDPQPVGSIFSILVQADGKILVGGAFTSMGGETRNRIARLDSDGSLDLDFDPNANSNVYSMALQADGKMVVGGAFTSIGGEAIQRIAMLNPDGTVDTDFAPQPNNIVYSVGLQQDGKVLAGGDFTNASGQARSHVARFSNSAALQQIVKDQFGTTLTWERSGSSPLFDWVAFEISTDGGAIWTDLGEATRNGTSTSWELTGLRLPGPQNLLIRATGYRTASEIYGGGCAYKAVRAFHQPIAVVINELDAFTQAGDSREFIELYDGGRRNTALDDFVAVLYDGTTDTSYAAYDLDGEATDENGYFVLGNSGVSNVDTVIPDGTLQDGADAVAIYWGEAADFPNGSPVTTEGLFDAVVYDRGQADDPGLLLLLNSGQAQVDESSNGFNPAGHSLQRISSGSGGSRNTSTYLALAPTPGEENGFAPPPGVPDLLPSSDLGISNADDLTSDATPTFQCTARAGSRIILSSDIDGTIGIGSTDETGAWTATVTLPITEGIHQITATADGSAASPPLAVTIDVTPPPVPTGLDLADGSDSGSSSSDDLTNDNTPTIDGDTGTGSIVTLHSNLDGEVGSGSASSPWSITTSALQDGVHNLTATTADDAGNDSAASSTLAITIDTTPPTATVDVAVGQNDPASTGPVLFTAAFDETVEGFESGDVSVGGTAAGAVDVSGGPSTFTLSIATTASEGFITASIPAGTVTDIAGNASATESGGTDNRVDLDVHAGTGGTGTLVPLVSGAGMFSGFLHSGDTDLFSFSISTNSTAHLFTTGSIDTWGVLRNSADAVLNNPYVDDDAGDGENFDTVRVLGIGDYTIAISSDSDDGDYTLQIEATPIPDPGATPDPAILALKSSLTRKLRKLKLKIKKAKKGGNRGKAKKLAKKFKKLKKQLASL